MMGLSFRIENAKINYHACAIMLSDGRILAMHDEHAAYSRLPGGRATLGETAEAAVLRETAFPLSS